MDKFLIPRSIIATGELGPVASSMTTHQSSYTELLKSKIHHTLKSIFGLADFRGEQERIILSTLQGGGKSLTFQLPALISPGITLVISPLIALIQNQVDALVKLKIKAASLNSSLKKTEKDKITKDLATGNPKTKLLYVTPELLATDKFRATMQKINKAGMLSRIVVDEAHCISEWGHDFRDDYRKLSYWKDTYPTIPIMALTATAIASVQADIVKQLHLDTSLNTFISSFNRPNLHYEVRFKPLDTNDPFNDIIKFLNNVYESRRERLKKSNSEGRSTALCGIIYCGTRKTCEDVASMLRTNQIRAQCYHAGLSPKTRKQILQAWSGTDVTTAVSTPKEKKTKRASASTTPSKQTSTAKHGTTEPLIPGETVDIVVATISFGMGIDKKDVRFVIHWDMPKSFEGYYQESGRAGRDGKVSRCILYYSRQDRDRHVFMLQQQLNSLDSAYRTHAMQSFNELVRYCENDSICRHKYTDEYFSEKKIMVDLNVQTKKLKRTLIESKNQDELCPEKHCDICRDPLKVKKMVKAALSNPSVHKPRFGADLADMPVMPCSSAIEKFGGFKSARELNMTRLKDGSVVGVVRKRTLDMFSTDPDMDDLAAQSSAVCSAIHPYNEESRQDDYNGRQYQESSNYRHQTSTGTKTNHSDFQTASGKSIKVDPAAKRLFLFGKKGLKETVSNTPLSQLELRTTSTFPIRSPAAKTVQGMNITDRERSFERIYNELKNVFPILECSSNWIWNLVCIDNPDERSHFLLQVAADIEARCYRGTKLAMIYNNYIVARIREIKNLKQPEHLQTWITGTAVEVILSKNAQQPIQGST
ncbi:hypothetical protein BATDEDRAFT_85181 [Batrachochytrium dendrobatidis JAM81]|uniref:ATP-dependent DNA helicase n=1 Tax=Batrachochytrium dendrobatidis (strain JAM81 / FGSC 10211) TaxID=684364 RepID=F4NV56_BATDJ|nr:uncharacterized protein BATDEDRAFT_85181 [Batrachochytrium dendrobatidis JAM81]EGF83667.1 hypothetical protein BATDEDRAFT_85181 [Batrachochytrium dendrobatidis JAM81]|eukprot:XP_006676181.1 hypothetical protein BATDEDRAFT_85181 [Batrachochytrium dendrobatidis JAM81]